MSHDFNADQAAEIVRGAFSPLICHAQSSHYGRRLSFVVTNGDDTVLTVDELATDQFSTERRLQVIILESRAVVEELGFTLDPWTFSAAA